MDLSFFRDKKVLVTGHTGFKGAWLCKVLLMAGAKVTGYSLEPPTNPSLFELIGLKSEMYSVIGDVRDFEHMKSVFAEREPEIVIHMAAQPLVRESYKNPVLTYDTNVMGTVNVLECVRLTTSIKSFLNVTTDKVYRNDEQDRGFVEEDVLGGLDPYSNSKSCSELVTESYRKSFFDNLQDRSVAISTVRAGNVIGGGDFATDRIVPDCVRAAVKNEDVVVRNPFSIRPYQHVLEPIMAYLMIVRKQYEDVSYAGCYNVGPDETDCKTTGELVQIFCDEWNVNSENKLSWIDCYDGGPHEAKFLKLDCGKLKRVFGWNPRWNVSKAVAKTVEWTKVYLDMHNPKDIHNIMIKQITEFLGDKKL